MNMIVEGTNNVNLEILLCGAEHISEVDEEGCGQAYQDVVNSKHLLLKEEQELSM
jgi:hypothetical protein